MTKYEEGTVVRGTMFVRGQAEVFNKRFVKIGPDNTYENWVCLQDGSHWHVGDGRYTMTVLEVIYSPSGLDGPVEECVFCAKIAEEHERIKVEGYNGVVSFEPLNPVTRGHRLFVPVEHAESASESPQGAAWAFEAAAKYGQERDEDFNLITSAGEDASQTIKHTHIHYVPRHHNDGLLLPWTLQKIRIQAEGLRDAVKSAVDRAAKRGDMLF